MNGWQSFRTCSYSTILPRDQLIICRFLFICVLYSTRQIENFRRNYRINIYWKRVLGCCFGNCNVFIMIIFVFFFAFVCSQEPIKLHAFVSLLFHFTCVCSSRDFYFYSNTTDAKMGACASKISFSHKFSSGTNSVNSLSYVAWNQFTRLYLIAKQSRVLNSVAARFKRNNEWNDDAEIADCDSKCKLQIQYALLLSSAPTPLGLLPAPWW